MSEKFRIDLGYDPLFASASLNTKSDASVVVYDTTTQAFYYTGSYITVSGSTETSVAVVSAAANTDFPVTLNVNAATSKLYQDPNDFKYNPNTNILIVNGTISSSNFINVGTVANTKITGSFTGSLTGDLTGTASYATSASYALSASHEIIKEVSSSHADTASYVEAGNINQPFTHITASGHISSSGGTITGLNYQNTGTVANTDLTGSFTGSLTGALTGTSSHATNADNVSSASFATVAAGLVHTPDISVGTLTNASTVAGSKITGSFTGSYSGSFFGSITNIAVSANDEINATFPLVFANTEDPATLYRDPNSAHLGFNPVKNHIFLSGSVISTGSILLSGSIINNESTIANTKITGSFTGSFVGTSSYAGSSSHAVTASHALTAITASHALSVSALAQTLIANTGSFSGGVIVNGGKQIADGISVLGPISSSGNMTANSFIGPLTGTASHAVTSSHAVTALTASYALTTLTASYALTATSASDAAVAGIAIAAQAALTAITASHALSVSALAQTLIANTGSFPGGVIVNGGKQIADGISVLGNISASGTGSFSRLNLLNLTAIVDNTTLVIDSNKVVGTRELGANAFTNDALLAQGNLLADVFPKMVDADGRTTEDSILYQIGTTISASGGTITGLNYINTGTVANSKVTGSFTGSYSGTGASLTQIGTTVAGTLVTGSFTGSLTGALTGTSSHATNADDASSASFATVAAGIIHNPNISVGTLTNASTVAGSKITGSFTGSLTGDINIGTITLNTGSQGSTPLGFASGQIVYFGGTSGVVAGAIVVLKSNGLWAYANATNDSLSTGSLGMALGTNPSTDGVLMNGFTKLLALSNGQNGAIGDPIYLNNAGGSGQIDPPNADGNIVRIIGHLISGSTDAGSAMIHFCPSPDFIEHA